MAENRSNPWKVIIALSVVVIVVIIGAVILSKPSLTYNSSINKSLKDLDQKDVLFYPWQLADVINNGNKDVVLFDIRNDYDFGQGHIPGAENVPATDLTQKEFIKRMKKLREKNITVVLYGNDQLQANGPWMFLRQVGFNNVKVLPGGYDYYLQHRNDLAATKTDSALEKGVPRYDFAKMAASKKGASVNVQTETKPVSIKRRKKTTVVQGGC
ncbi:MAG TPA: rhodanese-like domain-containing protein [Bacteroidales bacterium]|nr:rhodanese-like domain-containing protein [Bacteroidales bacterium]